MKKFLFGSTGLITLAGCGMTAVEKADLAGQDSVAIVDTAGDEAEPDTGPMMPVRMMLDPTMVLDLAKTMRERKATNSNPLPAPPAMKAPLQMMSHPQNQALKRMIRPMSQHPQRASSHSLAKWFPPSAALPG